VLTAPAVNGGAILRIAGEFETQETDRPVQRPDLETPAADIETAPAAAEILELPEVTELPIDQAQAEMVRWRLQVLLVQRSQAGCEGARGASSRR